MLLPKRDEAIRFFPLGPGSLQTLKCQIWVKSTVDPSTELSLNKIIYYCRITRIALEAVFLGSLESKEERLNVHVLLR